MRPGRREALIFGGVGLAAAAAGLYLGPWLLRPAGSTASLLAASFTDLAGQPRKLAEWKGRVLVCNFWATWCAPCREEIPLLVAAREKYASNGVEILGIAVDSAAKVREFVNTLQIPYPVLLGGGEALEVMRDLGNPSGGLPFTVFLDRDGRLAQQRLGLLRQAELEAGLGRLVR